MRPCLPGPERGHVGRYAPSPTGDLHLGNARTALLAWLWARAAGGALPAARRGPRPRARPRRAPRRRQLADLARLGLDWDGEVVRQSDRGALYAAALATARGAPGCVYPCFCSRADIRAAASAPHGAEGHRYPGTCRGAAAGRGGGAAGGRVEPAALRFRVRRRR